MVTSISHSAADTEALGEELGRTAASGLVIALSGELGTGKTQFVKGLARGLGISERVHSPTFSLVNIHNGGRLTLFHLDLYRLETPEQVASAGLEVYFAPAGVTAIEWAERVFGPFPRPELTGSGSRPPRETTDSITSLPGFPRRLLWATLEALSETERRICYERFGA